MGKFKKILKKGKEIVDKAKVKKKRLTAQQKRDREKIAILTATAPPAGYVLYKGQKVMVAEKEGQRRRIEKQKEREAEKKKKENKKTKPKKMKTGGIAIKGFGKAFLKGKK